MMDFDLITAVSRAQNGDAEAFDFVVEHTLRMAKSYAFHLLRNTSTAEDAIQDAYMQAWRDLPKLDSPEAFVSWLKRIIFKHCDRIMRSAHPTELLDDSLSGGADHDLCSDFPQFGPFAELHSALDSLPEHLRQPILLYYLNDYDVREISESLDLPSSTVKNRLYAGRKQLRKDLWFMDTSTDFEQSEASRDREIRRSIMSKILDDFKKQEKRDPLTADYSLLEKGRLAFLDFLKKGKEISSEEMRNGRFFLRRKKQFGVLASAFIRYMTQNLSVAERAWAYFQLIEAFIYGDFGKMELGRGYSAAAILAYEEFERWLPGRQFVLAFENPHSPVYESPSEKDWTEKDISVLLLYSIGHAYQGVWRGEEYFSKVDAVFASEATSAKNAYKRFELLTCACYTELWRSKDDETEVIHADKYLKMMSQTIELIDDEEERMETGHRLMENSFKLAELRKDEEKKADIVDRYFELLERDERKGIGRKMVSMAKHNLGVCMMDVGKHDVALQLYLSLERDPDSTYNGNSRYFHAIALWKVTKDREGTLALLRKSRVTIADSMLEPFLSREEFADVRNDPEFLETVGR
jgi:RNA polymerase sigma factor (sigma-70 family)